MKIRTTLAILVLATSLFALACQEPVKPTGGGLPESLSDVPAVRLSYRYEADVPAPTEQTAVQNDGIDAAVQADFELNRPQETIDRTIVSPDGKRIAVVYTRANDQPGDHRLDMYAAGGTVIRKFTSDLMAVHFPGTIRWSPDSRTVAFVAMLRTASAIPEATPTPNAPSPDIPPVGENGNTNTAPVEAATPAPAPTPEAPTGILTFRTDQLYVADADGGVTRPLTQNESLVYYYYEWSPDSSMLVTLAATAVEWAYLERISKDRGEVFVPSGRPRVVEKNGRERLLDDALTNVYPVWSPDSTKIACGFDKQVRVYDAGGTVPTQAAIPLRNNLLLSSQAYDQSQAQNLGATNADGAAPPVTTNSNNVGATLPDPNTLVSFNPIVALHWPSNDLLYFQTAFMKRMLNEADSVSSFPRWHRLILTPQVPTN